MKTSELTTFCIVPSIDLLDIKSPKDGLFIQTNNFCNKKFLSHTECKEFYKSISLKETGWYRCPFGFSAYRCSIEGRQLALTSIIPLPRLANTRDPQEDERLKLQPQSKVERSTVEKSLVTLNQVINQYSNLEKESFQRLPHALHEIRKLNAIIKTESENAFEKTNDRKWETVSKASEMMSSQFDLLDMLINESITDLPVNCNSALDSLVYKCTKIYSIRAAQKNCVVSYAERTSVTVRCCSKTLPILITVFIENAIKYSPENGEICVRVFKDSEYAYFEVKNRGTLKIKPEQLFKKGIRGDSNIEGSGIGLYLANRVATQHAGDISARQVDDMVAVTFKMKFVQPQKW